MHQNYVDPSWLEKLGREVRDLIVVCSLSAIIGAGLVWLVSATAEPESVQVPELAPIVITQDVEGYWI